MGRKARPSTYPSSRDDKTAAVGASLACGDIVDFHPARQHSSRGNWMDHRDKDHHHSGWPLYESDSADAIRNLFSERVLGTSRSRVPGLLAKEKSGTSEGTASVQSGLRPEKNMASYPISPHPRDEPQKISDVASPQTATSRLHISARNRFLFFLVAWLIVLMPFLFWWNTWFGRHLSDTQISEYLSDNKHPRRIQHALVQLGERMERRDASAAYWYPELVRLASHPVEEVRNTDAWLMGLDTSYEGFHATLLKMLEDSSTVVRGNAALSLVRFGDASGRAQIVALLKPARIVAPVAGRVADSDKVGTAVHQGGLIAKLSYGHEQAMELRSPIGGRIRTLSVTVGSNVAS